MGLGSKMLAAVLASLVALQPIRATSPGCTIGGLLTGRGVCCCAEPADAPASSCCSTASSSESSEGVSVESGKRICDCEVDAPAPTSALPVATGARSDHGGSLELAHWIDQGASASACMPILSTASPPGETGLRPSSPRNPAHGLARGARGLLAVTCAARC